MGRHVNDMNQRATIPALSGQADWIRLLNWKRCSVVFHSADGRNRCCGIYFVFSECIHPSSTRRTIVILTNYNLIAYNDIMLYFVQVAVITSAQ